MNREDALRPYLEAGLDLIPIHRWSDKAPDGREIGKAPLGRRWQLRRHAPDAWRDWLARDLNVGLRIAADQVVIDYDPRNDPRAREIDNSLARLAMALSLVDPSFTAWPCVRTGGGGWHVYMQLSCEMRVINDLSDFPGVEFKGHGRQVLVAGSRHPSGSWYEWDDFSLPLASGGLPPAPEALEALIRRPDAPEGPGEAPEGTGRLTGAKVGELLRSLDAEDYRDYDEWLQMGFSCWYACAGAPEGRDAFVEWSARDPQYAGHEAAVGERWVTFAPGGQAQPITHRLLFDRVLAAGGRLDGVDAFPDLPPLGEGEECRNAGGAAAADEEDLPPRGILEELNERFCVAKMGGQTKIVGYEDGEWSFFSQSAFETWCADLRPPPHEGPGRPPGNAGTAWLRWPGRRNVRGVEFAPGRPAQPGWLNMWTGWAVEPAPGGSWDRLRALIYEVLCDGDVDAGDYVLDWCAWLYQRPWVLPEVAIVLRGGKGAGKGTFGRAMCALAGPHAMQFSDAKLLAGPFNAHIEDKVLLFADEAFWAANRQSEAALKQLVTEPENVWHRKGLTPRPGRNYAHLIMASNADWVAPASMDERRFCVLDVPGDRIRDHRFFLALNRELYEEGGIGALAAHLAERELGVHPRENVPQTAGLVAQKLLSMDPLYEAWYAILERGRMPGAEDADWEAEEVYVERETLVRELARAAEKAGGRFDFARSASTKVGLMLRRLCPSARTQKSRSDRRYLIPPLAGARADFERALGRPISWTE